MSVKKQIVRYVYTIETTLNEFKYFLTYIDLKAFCNIIKWIF